MTADTSVSSNKMGWRKTVVTVAAIVALTFLAYLQPEYTGEVVVGFLGIIGIHSASVS